MSEGGVHKRHELRRDLRLVADMVAAGSRVLDVGCGDGALLAVLAREKGVDGRGIELSQAGVNACVAHGLSVIQGDADTDLADFPDTSFDYAILSQTLQAVRRPREVLRHLLRIGTRAIVSFPNFGYWRARHYLFVKGRMPLTTMLDLPWYATTNIHPCTITDFLDLCRASGFTIERAYALSHDGRASPIDNGFAINLFAEQAIFELSGRGSRLARAGEPSAEQAD